MAGPQPAWIQIRKAVIVAAWRHVWSLRRIAIPTVGTPNARQVAAPNLLAKKKGTFAFPEPHHEDHTCADLAGRIKSLFST